MFIVNPIAGTAGKEGMAAAIASAIDRSYYDFDIACTAYGGHAAELAAKARDEGAFCVVAVGGDGTVNEVARSLVHSDTALGIIPCGSGNGLARHLMLPSDPREAVGVINMHTVHDLDYGLINGHPFFCTCGMGFDAFVSVKFAEAGRRGLMAYLENILREFPHIMRQCLAVWQQCLHSPAGLDERRPARRYRHGTVRHARGSADKH